MMRLEVDLKAASPKVVAALKNEREVFLTRDVVLLKTFFPIRGLEAFLDNR